MRFLFIYKAILWKLECILVEIKIRYVIIWQELENEAILLLSFLYLYLVYRRFYTDKFFNQFMKSLSIFLSD